MGGNLSLPQYYTNAESISASDGMEYHPNPSLFAQVMERFKLDANSICVQPDVDGRSAYGYTEEGRRQDIKTYQGPCYVIKEYPDGSILFGVKIEGKIVFVQPFFVKT